MAKTNKKKRVRRNVSNGIAHIHATFNNTTVTVTDNRGEAPLRDTFRVKNPTREANEGTFNGFRGRRGGGRIDWILTSPAWQVQSAKIMTYNQDGRYPSDHFPVTAVLQ